jgi:mannose-6-phosphate isomerase-like protein (cupin superfamily)
MATQLPDVGASDEVQIFDPGQILSEAAGELQDRRGLATSPNCDILLRQAPPGGGLEVETDAHSDQIIFVLRGECRVEAPSGEYSLGANGGALVRSGTTVRCVNSGTSELALLTLRTGAGEERPGYVPNRPSGVFLRVPAAEISARGLPRHLYVFAMSQRIIGIGTNATEEWNLGSLLRMNCQYVRDGDDVLVNLPERMVRWYRLRDVAEGDYRIISDPDHWRCRIDLTPLIEREATAARS